MTVTQMQLDQAALVLIVGEDGIYEWSSTKNAPDVATQLRRIATDITQAHHIARASDD